MAVILKGEYIPMRKNLAKLIALMMALVLVFSFAACGGNDEEPTTTSADNEVVTEDAGTPGETGDTAASDGTSDTAAPGESKQDDATNKTDPDTPAPGGVAAPSDKAAGVKLFNDALGKVSSTTTYVDRKLTKCDATIVGNLDKLGPVSETFAKGSGNVNVKLSSLSAGDVKDYSYTTSGNNYVMTFKLGTVNGSTNLKHGNGGYMYFLTMDEIATVVNQIGKQIGGNSFSIEMYKDQSSISLQGGTLTVTVDKTTGKMSKAVITFKEVIDGKCKAKVGPLPANITADLVGEGTVTFTLK